jgi:hypothetical protein
LIPIMLSNLSRSIQLKFLYVAITRARKNMWIADSSKRGEPMRVSLHWNLIIVRNDTTACPRYSGPVETRYKIVHWVPMYRNWRFRPQPTNGQAKARSSSSGRNICRQDTVTREHPYLVKRHQPMPITFGNKLAKHLRKVLGRHGWLNEMPSSVRQRLSVTVPFQIRSGTEEHTSGSPENASSVREMIVKQLGHTLTLRNLMMPLNYIERLVCSMRLSRSLKCMDARCYQPWSIVSLTLHVCSTSLSKSLSVFYWLVSLR